jgi:hypothetical protein
MLPILVNSQSMAMERNYSPPNGMILQVFPENAWASSTKESATNAKERSIIAIKLELSL